MSDVSHIYPLFFTEMFVKEELPRHLDSSFECRIVHAPWGHLRDQQCILFPLDSVHYH